MYQGTVGFQTTQASTVSYSLRSSNSPHHPLLTPSNAGSPSQQSHLDSLHPTTRPEAYWSFHASLPSTIAYTAQSRPAAAPALRNLYEGDAAAKQLNESVDEFLHRLPPSSSTWADVGPWIWVANPHVPHHPVREDFAELTKRGSRLLDEFAAFRTAAGKGSRAVKPARERLEKALREVAGKTGVVTGKWMLFPSVEQLDQTWRAVVEGVVDNKLGTAAKVATGESDRDPSARLICVYTKDFSDVKDVRRVLDKLVEMGLVQSNGDARGIYYKYDAYTHLGIESGNEWQLKASLYGSKEMLKKI